ncbi:hypothetical protein [Candidatus Venteria ishoeyi]|nr:hypothetical protein [Candidatus Venteria ishoeyi]
MNSLYAQTTEPKITMNSFEIEGSDLEELQDFKWRTVKKFFKGNEKNDSIRIVIKYNNESTENPETQVKITSLETEIKGQTRDLNKMIRTARKVSKKLLKNTLE